MRDVLTEYIEKIVPKLIEGGYHLELAKGSIEVGQDYHERLSQQTMLSHLVNGVFGFSRLWTYLDESGILPYDEVNYRRFLSLFTLHDVHKTSAERLGSSDFSVPLEVFAANRATLGLDTFADTDLHEHRAANVSSRSSYQGDLSLSTQPGAVTRWRMVRVADSMASVTSPREGSGVWSHLKDLDSRLALNYRLHWHELADLRGVLTNQVHAAVANHLQAEFDCFPLLYFASGTLYLGPKNLPGFDRRAFVEELAQALAGLLEPSAEAQFDPAEAYRRENYDFQSYVYAVLTPDRLLDFALEKGLTVSGGKSGGKFYADEMAKWFGKARKKETPFANRKEFETVLCIGPEKQEEAFNQLLGGVTTEQEQAETQRWVEDKAFNQLLGGVTVYLYVADSILRDTSQPLPEARVRRWGEILGVPADVTETLAPLAPAFWNAFGGGKLPKYVLPLAYHWLTGPTFAARSAVACDRGEVFNRLHEQVSSAFATIDSRAVAGRVTDELHLTEDLRLYLRERLRVSLDETADVTDNPWPVLMKGKTRTPGLICSVCSRHSPHAIPIRTGVLGDSAQEFSNWCLPSPTTDKCRLWCPTCYFEFALRAIAGLTAPPGTERRNSARLSLYLLPTYSFTPEMVSMFAEDTLRPFQDVTALTVRDYGQRHSHAHIWLEAGREGEGPRFDEELRENLLEVFRQQVEWLAAIPEESKTQRPRREMAGERLFTAHPQRVQQLNYLYFVWERTAYGNSEDALIPTASEMWTKGAFAACLLAALTGYKVYVTERPYLPLADPTVMKPLVVLDSPHNALREILKPQPIGAMTPFERGLPRVSTSPDESVGRCSTTLLEALDLLAALWQINSDLRDVEARELTKDKHVVSCLERLMANPLAGAFFYKQYARLNDDATPFPIFITACDVLLQRRGGEWMNLAQDLAEKSLLLFLPFPQYGRGKAHAYELVFREAVDALRKAPAANRVELKTLAAGRLLKRLEQRQQTRRGEGIVNPERGNLNALVDDFIGTLADEVLDGRAGGSLAAFNRLANSFADAIYKVTDGCVRERFEAWKQKYGRKEGGNNESDHI